MKSSGRWAALSALIAETDLKAVASSAEAEVLSSGGHDVQARVTRALAWERRRMAELMRGVLHEWAMCSAGGCGQMPRASTAGEPKAVA